MSNIFGLAADLHMHPWTAFSTTLDTGLNSRFAAQLTELRRLAMETHAAGGIFVVLAGDVFHVRGSVAPTVLNALRDEMTQLTAEFGTQWIILSGNHDLEGRHSTRLGSAVTALECDSVQVINETTYLAGLDMTLIPWIESVEDLKAEIVGAPKTANLVLHAPIDGVIPGLPDHGLTAEWLAQQGFGRVWSGHYHNHKSMAGDKVVSIGALCHHTWSDIGAKAGFHVVNGSTYRWFATHLPQFIDLDEIARVTTDPSEVPLLVDGNFIRIKIEASKIQEVEDAKKELLAMGAAGVLVRALPKPDPSITRVSATVSAGASLEVSVSDYAKGMTTTADKEAVAREAMDILNSIKVE